MLFLAIVHTRESTSLEVNSMVLSLVISQSSQLIPHQQHEVLNLTEESMMFVPDPVNHPSLHSINMTSRLGSRHSGDYDIFSFDWGFSIRHACSQLSKR